MGFFAAALTHLVPGLLLVVHQQHLRQNLVDRAPQTVTVAPNSACRGWREGVNWAELGDWGRVLGLWVTGLSGWGKAYQKEARPTTNMSIALKILIPPKSTRRSTCTQGSEDCVRTRIMWHFLFGVGTGEWVLSSSRHGDCVGKFEIARAEAKHAHRGCGRSQRQGAAQTQRTHGAPGYSGAAGRTAALTRARARQPRPLPSTARRLAVTLATSTWKTMKTDHNSRRDGPLPSLPRSVYSLSVGKLQFRFRN